MEPTSTIALATALIPFIVAGIKKIFRTDRLSERTRSTLHTLLPLATGVLTTGWVEFERSHDWKLAVAIGLGSGGLASSLRDTGKNSGLTAQFLDSNPKDEQRQ